MEEQRDIYPIARTRRVWNIFSFDIVDEPLIRSIFRYKRFEDREEVPTSFSSLGDRTERYAFGSINGVGSKDINNKHLPIIDLDYDHCYVPSTTSDHAHLYLNVPISGFRWFILMTALYIAKVIEPGYYLWSLRRGHNQVRMPGVKKGPGAERGYYTHGWFRKLKKYR